MDKYIAEPTSTGDLFKIAGKRCNVYCYGDLKNFDDIEDIFTNGGARKYEIVEEYSDSDSESSYEEIEETVEETIEEVFDDEYPFDDNAAIILYKSEPKFGHWTMVAKNDGDYNYLDSYGQPIDNPLSYVPNYVNEELGQDKKYLARLLLKAMDKGSDVYYNNAKLQKLDPNVATCGRYCALYLKYSYMNVDDFAKMIKKISKDLDISNDEVVTYLSMVDLDSESPIQV